MAVNTRFAMAVHIMFRLAAEPSKFHTSAALATLLNTNPVVIRKVLSALRRAELVRCQKGPTGGSRLYQSSKVITLADIYDAVESNALFFTPSPPNPFAVRINAVLDQSFMSAKKCALGHLGQIPLKQLVMKVKRSHRSKV